VKTVILIKYINKVGKWNVNVQTQMMGFPCKKTFAIFAFKSYKKENMINTSKAAIKKKYFIILREINHSQE
jgi:hypothetical protein